jgi:F-type H+-transporting ATPase subunit a
VPGTAGFCGLRPDDTTEDGAVSGQALAFAAEEVPWPPSVHDVYLPSIAAGPWITKFTLMVWLAVALVIVFFLATYRNPKLVPGKGQWLAESVYGFIRKGVGEEVIGSEGLRFAPYLTTLFLFVFVTNIFGVIPGLQISPNSHIAFPIVLAIISYVLFMYQGVRRHGVGKYLKMNLIPDAPAPLLIILVPIEFFSTFVLRPVTLSLRLFANMFAGHMLLLVFTLGGFVLLGANNIAIQGVSLLSFAMAIILTLFEVIVALLQAYVFAVLTASYLQGALADEH